MILLSIFFCSNSSHFSNRDSQLRTAKFNQAKLSVIPLSGNLFFCRFIACHCARAGTVVFPKMLKCQFIQPAVKIYLSQIALRNSLSIFQICHFFWVPEKIIFNANTKSAKIDFSLENFCVGRISWLNSTKPDK